ncbi:hypothetical protein B0T24DRAFT_525525 [Lasiosphaeria ovina]|uniref:Uncharacterized protein n=1 Tax=Lasiosphaeria ovina TaxID=92902 RepID=A0AAE0NB63_9PEZI|nr:hypothetical protein B0T24DRAFT_525525 [Lasiosphaeria ovina]
MTSLAREGFTIDHVGRFVRDSLLNERLTLPIALLAFFLCLDLSESYRDTLANAASWMGGRLDVERIAKAGRIALYLGLVGALISLGKMFVKWTANNREATNPGDWDWEKREIVLVTGGSAGLGASVAQKLLARNPLITIVVLDIAPLGWVPPEGSKVHYYQVDLGNSSDTQFVCDRVKREVGHPTVLISNACLAHSFAIMESSYDDIIRTIATNLTSTFLLVNEFVPEMTRNNHGHIITVSSMGDHIRGVDSADYYAANVGISELHEALRMELTYSHDAPKVRLTKAKFNLLRSPLVKDESGIANFFSPRLHLETASQSIVDVIFSGYGKTIVLPGSMRYSSTLVRDFSSSGL